MKSVHDVLLVLAELVSMRTIANRPDELVRAIDYCERFFADIPGLFVRRYLSHDKPSLVVSTHDTLTPEVLLLGHLDVVPGSDALFTIREENGRISGRGVCDMKGPDAVMMLLMREIALCAVHERPNLALMLTTDEEVGGKHGAHYLVDTIGYRARVVVAPDGGNRPDQIVHHNKGGLVLQLVAMGKAGHGARPWLGENAIHRLMLAYQEIHAVFPLSTHEDSWNNTCNVGMIEGGAAANQIPGRASCTIDVRVLDGAQAAAVLGAIREIAAAHRCDVEILEDVAPSYTDPSNPYVRMYADAVEKQLGAPAQFIRSHGADDGRFFSARGIPVICSRPLSGDQHSEMEWVERESLMQFYSILRGFIGDNKVGSDALTNASHSGIVQR